MNLTNETIQNSRKKTILLSSGLLGVMLASGFWLFRSFVPNGMTDKEAKKRGYFSAEELNQTKRFTEYDASKPRQKFEFTPDEFRLLEKTLHEGSSSARDNAYLGIGFLTQTEQRNRALSLLRPMILKGEVNVLTRGVLERYTIFGGRSLIEGWAKDPDPAISQLAKSTLEEYDARVAQNANKKRRTGGKKGE